LYNFVKQIKNCTVVQELTDILEQLLSMLYMITDRTNYHHYENFMTGP